MDLQKSYIRAVIQGNSIIEDENTIYHYEKIIYSGTPYLYIRYKEPMYFSMIEEEIKKCSAFNTHPSYQLIFTTRLTPSSTTHLRCYCGTKDCHSSTK